MYFIGLSMIFFVLNSCWFLPGTCYVENRSTRQLDTVTINLNGHRIIFTQVPPNSRKELNISKNLLSSGHDFMAEGYIVSQGDRFTAPYTFTDLGGSYSEAGIIFSEDLKANVSLK
jgi:hypothetical protein